MATKEEILNTFTSKEGAWFAYNEGLRVGYNEAFNSLRNQAAIAAMQSFIGKFNINIRDSADCEKITKLAVEQADALIKELKKK